jgi:ABC-type multidrug transport system permease subunit
MDVFTIDKLFIFIAFIVPGFVSLKAYEIFVPTQKIDSTKILIEAITYSCINYALLFMPVNICSSDGWLDVKEFSP